MSGFRYKTEVYQCTVPVEEYLESCLDVPRFLGYCRQCENYGKIWSCPDFDFDPEAYFRQYDTITILGHKIILDEELTSKTVTKEEQKQLLDDLLEGPKKRLDRELLEMESRHPGSRALSGGSCLYCNPGSCARLTGDPCRFPEKMRYSIEALGGNVGLTVTKYLHQELEWMEDRHLPHHFILVGGLLYNQPHS